MLHFLSSNMVMIYFSPTCVINHTTHVNREKPSSPSVFFIFYSHTSDTRRMRGFPQNKQFYDTYWVCYNSTHFWHRVPGDCVRSCRLRVRSCMTAPTPNTHTSVARGKSRLSPGFWEAEHQRSPQPLSWAELICRSSSWKSGRESTYCLSLYYERRR